MIINQLSVFVENKPGRLCAILDVLREHDVDISAMSLADTAEFGILRLIVDQPDKAKDVLKSVGITVRVTSVNAVAMDDVPGGASSIIRLLAEKRINIEYLYACVGKISGKALMVMRADSTEKCEEVLHKNGFGNVNPSDVYRIG